MKKQADITFQHNKLVLSGDLDCSNVMSVYEKSLPYLQRCSTLEFDFSQITSSNSAGLALIIEWLKYAKEHSKVIQFFSLSADLMLIAKVAGLEKIIPN